MNIIICMLHITAFGGRDFNSIHSMVITFPASILSQQSRVIPITIINDEIVENDEDFGVLLTLLTADPGILLQPAEAVITIMDDDGGFCHAMIKKCDSKSGISVMNFTIPFLFVSLFLLLFSQAEVAFSFHQRMIILNEGTDTVTILIDKNRTTVETFILSVTGRMFYF